MVSPSPESELTIGFGIRSFFRERDDEKECKNP
jgi:hypothetical protein